MECPKCHKKIKFYDWSQTCKNCGVNLVYYNLEETLIADAKETEMSFARARVFAAKIKGALIGGPLQIVRLVMMLVSLGVMMIPFVTVKAETAFFNESISINLLNVYNAFSGGKLDALNAMSSSAVVGKLANATYVAMLLVLIAAIIGIAQLLTVILSMFSPRALSGVSGFFSVAGIGVCVAYAVMSGNLVDAAEALGFANVSNGFGAYVTMVAFAAMAAINIVFAVKGFTFKYKDGDLYRCEVYRKVKAGEITLDELPLPIFETEEEKAERLAEFAEMEADNEEKEEAING